SSMSISRGSGVEVTSSAAAISSSVVLPRAESTATTRWPSSFARTMRAAARLMRSASATDVPPNFITTVPDTGRSLGGAGRAPDVRLRSDPGQAHGGLVDHLVALAEGEADERATDRLVVVEDTAGHRDDADALGQAPAERAAVVLPQRAD